MWPGVIVKGLQTRPCFWRLNLLGATWTLLIGSITSFKSDTIHAVQCDAIWQQNEQGHCGSGCCSGLPEMTPGKPGTQTQCSGGFFSDIASILPHGRPASPCACWVQASNTAVDYARLVSVSWQF